MKRRRFLYLSAGSAATLGGLAVAKFIDVRGPLLRLPLTMGALNKQDTRTLSSLCEILLPDIDNQSVQFVETVIKAQCLQRPGYLQGLLLSSNLLNGYSAKHNNQLFISLSLDNKINIVKDILWDRKLFLGSTRLNHAYEKLLISKARRIFYKYAYRNLATIVYDIPIGWKRSVNYNQSPGYPAPDPFGYENSINIG